jgi:hypothetical protein
MSYEEGGRRRRKSHKGGRKQKRLHGKGFFDTIKKGFNLVKDNMGNLKKGYDFVRDNALVSKGLSQANKIASAMGKDGIADKLGEFESNVKSYGFGRRRRQGGRGLFDFLNNIPIVGSMASGMLNGLTGGRRRRLHGRGDIEQHGEGMFDILGNLRSLIPIASSLMGGRRRKHHGGGLNMAGGGGHTWGNQEYPNNYSEKGLHGGSLHLAGEGSGRFGRINRGHSKMVHH